MVDSLHLTSTCGITELALTTVSTALNEAYAVCCGYQPPVNNIDIACTHTMSHAGHVIHDLGRLLPFPVLIPAPKKCAQVDNTIIWIVVHGQHAHALFPCSVLQSGCPTPQNIPSFSMMDGIGGTELLSCPIALDTLPLHKTPRNELTPEQQEERAQRKAVSDLKRLQLANAQALRDNQCAAEQQHVKEEKEAQERLAKRQERDALCRLRQRQVEIEAKRAKAKAEQQSREQQLRRAANAVKRCVVCALLCSQVLCLIVALQLHGICASNAASV